MRLLAVLSIAAGALGLPGVAAAAVAPWEPAPQLGDVPHVCAEYEYLTSSTCLVQSRALTFTIEPKVVDVGGVLTATANVHFAKTVAWSWDSLGLGTRLACGPDRIEAEGPNFAVSTCKFKTTAPTGGWRVAQLSFSTFQNPAISRDYYAVMPTGGMVLGTIRYDRPDPATGAPRFLGGARVELVGTTGAAKGKRYFATTGGDGTYHAVLEAGKWVVTPRVDGVSPASRTVVIKKKRVRADFTVPAFLVSGTTRQSDCQAAAASCSLTPISNVAVTATSATGQVHTATTGSDGGYQLLLPKGSWTLEPSQIRRKWDPVFREVEVASDLGGQDFRSCKPVAGERRLAQRAEHPLLVEEQKCSTKYEVTLNAWIPQATMKDIVFGPQNASGTDFPWTVLSPMTPLTRFWPTCLTQSQQDSVAPRRFVGPVAYPDLVGASYRSVFVGSDRREYADSRNVGGVRVVFAWDGTTLVPLAQSGKLVKYAVTQGHLTRRFDFTSKHGFASCGVEKPVSARVVGESVQVTETAVGGHLATISFKLRIENPHRPFESLREIPSLANGIPDPKESLEKLLVRLCGTKPAGTSPRALADRAAYDRCVKQAKKDVEAFYSSRSKKWSWFKKLDQLLKQIKGDLKNFDNKLNGYNRVVTALKQLQYPGVDAVVSIYIENGGTSQGNPGTRLTVKGEYDQFPSWGLKIVRNGTDELTRWAPFSQNQVWTHTPALPPGTPANVIVDASATPVFGPAQVSARLLSDSTIHEIIEGKLPLIGSVVAPAPAAAARTDEIMLFGQSS